MTRRILVPYDDSEPARQALDRAVDLFPGDEIVALSVVDASSLPFVPNPTDDAFGEEEVEEFLDDAREDLARARERAARHGIDLRTDVRVGAPAREIVDYAETADVDHVVIGSHGRSGVARILLGSVAELVVRESPVPVTVVR